MNRLITVLTVLGFTAYLLAGLTWTLMPMLAPPQGIHPTGWTAADLILDRCKFCVVNPRGIKIQDDFDVHFQWTEAEITARGLIILCPWSLAVGALLWRKRRKRNEQRTGGYCRVAAPNSQFKR